MKNKMCNRICGLTLTGIVIPFLIQAQVAQWNFNNTLKGINSSTKVTTTNAVLGSAITRGDYNGGTVYFGEGGWPAGALDPNAYLEFSVEPTTAYSLTVSSMQLSIRKSTTGTSGSGPNDWALRSSLDGFASDISHGTLSTSVVAIPVTFTASFANLSSAVTFRLYGYNATVSSGGLNRFVYDNISISGSTILPVVFDSFRAGVNNNAADLTWTLGGEGDVSVMLVERSSNGIDFETIAQVKPGEQNTTGTYTYSDKIDHAAGTYSYRIGLVSIDGKAVYSPVQQVSFNASVSFTLETINSGAGNDIRFRISAEQAGVYQFNLYDMNGVKLGVKQINLSTGTQVLNMDNARNKSGIYILTAEHAGQQRVTKVAVL